MSRFGSLLLALQGWIAEAAAGLIWLADASRARPTLRLVEGPEGVFRLERDGGRDGPQTIVEMMTIAELGASSASAPSARAALKGAQLEIVLLNSHFLIRPLELPAQAAQFLDGVVRTQIDRITPWRVAEAAWGAAPPVSLGADRILAQVVATPRARLMSYAEALAPFGVGALTVSTEVESAGAAVRVPVLSQNLADAGRLRLWRRALTVGLAVASLTALAATGAWSYLGLSLDAEREHLEEAITARRAALLAQHKAAERDALREPLAIEALSKILPDGTHLTELNLEKGKATLAGVTDDAPGLIRLIEQSRQFASATFSAPTTRAPNESGERFHIETQIEPTWVGAP
jgi:general secretion pathway protein L